MAIEQLICNSCKIKYTIEWDEDENEEFYEPDFCPMCGNSICDYDYDDDDDE